MATQKKPPGVRLQVQDEMSIGQSDEQIGAALKFERVASLVRGMSASEAIREALVYQPRTNTPNVVGGSMPANPGEVVTLIGCWEVVSQPTNDCKYCGTPHMSIQIRNRRRRGAWLASWLGTLTDTCKMHGGDNIRAGRSARVQGMLGALRTRLNELENKLGENGLRLHSYRAIAARHRMQEVLERIAKGG